MKHTLLTTLALAALGASTLLADFSYQETTKITGGAMLNMMRMAGPFARQSREPMVSTVMVKGDRMATIRKENATVIDLDKETITNIDFARKTYWVMTFAEMKQAMEDAAERMKEARRSPQNENANVSFKVSAKPTGQTKDINGLQAKEIILTLEMEGAGQQPGQNGAMKMVVDSWFGPPVAGYDEVKAFYRKMGAKMAGYAPGSPMGAMGMGRPEMAKAFEQAGEEMAKMDGVPVMRVTTMTGAGGPPAQGGQSSASPGESGGAMGRLGLPGGFGGFGHKKTQEQQAQQSQQAEQPGTLMETTTELSDFSAGPVDASKFEVPAGFKQVQPAMMRRGRR